jgi:hypothetical protein
MHSKILGVTCSGLLALSACGPVVEGEAAGALAGGAIAFVTAKALDVDPEWELATALAGAAAGALVARNTATRECAYATGDGRYYTAPCPT